MKKPVCLGFPSAVTAPVPLQEVCQTHGTRAFQGHIRVRTCAEQTHPAIQEVNSWCSQHINIVVVEMLRIQQLSKNYFISFLASLILFFQTACMHLATTAHPQHAKYQQFDW